MPLIRLIPLVTALALALTAPAAAQNPFQAVAVVDERVITRFDVDQRARFLDLFGTPGDLRAVALERLIDERLQVAEARRRGIRPGDEEIREGMEEFASRVELSAEEFIAALARSGIAAEAFRDFVEAGVAWRAVLRQRYVGRIDISDATVERGRAVEAWQGEVRVLLSEIVLPPTEDNFELAEDISRGLLDFEEAASLYSASETRRDAGRLDWLALNALPEALREVVSELRPGQISPPLPLEDGILLFLLRAIDEGTRLPEARVEVEYVVARLPAEGAAMLQRLRAGADTCADFEALTADLPAEAVTRQTQMMPAVPGDLAPVLRRMDRREIAEAPGGRAVMLCSRMPEEELRLPMEAMRDRLLDERVEALAQGLLAELRAAAVIERR